MPYVSEAQRRAMFAAKAGKSTLGIPKSVGADFVAAGPASKNLPERKSSKSEKPLGQEFGA
jgi:hypothetical protein